MNIENKSERRTTLESESGEYQGFSQSKVKKKIEVESESEEKNTFLYFKNYIKIKFVKK